MARSIINNYKTWNINLQEFQDGKIYETDIYGNFVKDKITNELIERELWGNTINGFKAHKSYVDSFRKKEYIFDANGNPVLDENGNQTYKDLFDFEKAFYTLVQRFIDAIVNQYHIFKVIDIWRMNDYHKYGLRKVIYLGIAYALQNGQYYERIMPSNISIGGMNMSDNIIRWNMTTDIFGGIATTALEQLELDEYNEWTDYEKNVLIKENAINGVIEIIDEWED